MNTVAHAVALVQHVQAASLLEVVKDAVLGFLLIALLIGAVIGFFLGRIFGRRR